MHHLFHPTDGNEPVLSYCLWLVHVSLKNETERAFGGEITNEAAERTWAATATPAKRDHLANRNVK